MENESVHTMSRAEKVANLIAVTLPFAAFVAAVALTWNSLVGPADLALLAGMYLLTAIGVTVGFHRMLTHRAFQAHRATRYTFAVLGTMAVQGPVIAWVADHRKHHAFTDREGDPHSPHVGHGTGIAGLWHAHMGWLFAEQGQADWKRFAPDLYEDPGMRWINRQFVGLILAGLAIPALIGFAIAGPIGAATGLLWGGLVRVFLVHHVTWSVNSVCHYLGTRRFDVEDESTNVFWLALPSLGESWHHNHHAFPRSASHGLRWFELDASAWVIGLMDRVGLAWDVVRIPRERQLRRSAMVGARPDHMSD